MALTAGSRLGGYEIVASLGAGGMGEVYRARDTRLGRDVAIKILTDEVSSSPERLARFEREARIVARLNHPNIVTLYSVEEAAGTQFLVMELVEGRSLVDEITPGGISVEQALDRVIPLADALAAAHEKGVVHRDLKPANVMVTHDGRVKVLDFGVAKLMPAESNPERTETTGAPLSMTGEVLGTIPYMAPEQVFGDAVDARSDLFSFGVLLFELVAGRRPFVGKTFWEVARTIASEPAPLLTAVRPDVPADLERLVDRCLQKQPSDRFQDATALLGELRGLRQVMAAGAAPAAITSEPRVVSIAVLPFVNRSASADDEYFADGLSDELIGVLGRISGLRVSARASSFHFKGTDTPLADVGRALNVATLLDGSVRTVGARVRISVQLVKVPDGYALWSQTYDRTLDDVLTVQDDIAQSVVKELRATLLGEQRDSAASGRAKAEVDRAARGRSADPEAHRLYLLARHSMDRFSRDGTARAIAYLEQAVEQDPEFALAWAELSVAYVREVGFGLVQPEEGYGRARKAVERALTLEPALADGHAQIAWIRIFHDWDWQGARESLNKALALAPGSASILRLSGVLASVLGDPREAIRIYRRALEQDPLSAAAYHSLGLALQSVDDPQGAEEAFRKALELAPQRIATRAQLALTMLRDRPGEALKEATLEPEDGYRLWALAIVHRALGDPAAADAALDRLSDELADAWALQVAELRAVGGQRDQAFAWLDRAYAVRDPGLVHVRTDPRFRALHDDARWHGFLGRMGLEP